MRFMKIVLFQILLFGKSSFGEDCPVGEFRHNGDRFYFLSDHQVSADTAIGICSLMKGNLVPFSTSHRENVSLSYINEKYISGLQDVWTFHNSRRQNTRYAFNRTLPGWQQWRGLEKFKLYRSPTGDYNQTYYFCANDISRRGMAVVRSGCSKHLYPSIFKLYGGTEQTTKTTLLYNYWNNYAASRLSRFDGVFVGFNPSFSFDARLNSVCLPDIYVFIGARSDVNQTQWYWSDGSIAVEARFPIPDPKVCQQIAMNYFYNDNTEIWIFTAQNCNESKSHYVCEINFTSQAEPVQFNGTSLRVSWKVGDNLAESQSDDFVMQIFLDGKIHGVRSIKEDFVISDLKPSTYYVIQVVMRRIGCSKFNLTQTIQARTGLGIPGPVEGARVRNSTNSPNSECVIEWERVQDGSASYKIQILDESDSAILNELLISNPEPSAITPTCPIDLQVFPEMKTLKFQIAATSIQGTSSYKNVAGTCVVPPKPTMLTNTTLPETSTPASTIVFLKVMEVESTQYECVCMKQDEEDTTEYHHNTVSYHEASEDTAISGDGKD